MALTFFTMFEVINAFEAIHRRAVDVHVLASENIVTVDDPIVDLVEHVVS